jgi:hypothetical protein
MSGRAMRTGVAVVVLCVAGSLGACRESPGPRAVDSGLAETAAAPWFEEVAAARGIDFFHRSGHEGRHLLPEIMGGGGAFADVDGDGYLDVILIQSGSLAAPPGTPSGHRLYRNRGDGTFEDVSVVSGLAAVTGYGMGVAVGDFDNDGHPDIYITNLGPNVLLRNDGRGRFTDVTAAAGVAGSGWSTSATFVDVDGDGHLDLYVTRYLDWSPDRERECYSLTGLIDYCAPRNYDAPTADLLFRNNGDGTFTDVSHASGITAAVGNGLGVIADDVDGDGHMDIFVANDATPNHLWRNLGGWRFEEVALLSGVAIDQDGAPKAGMGVHAADVSGSGRNDILVVNLDTESDSFYRNEGTFFVDATNAVGLRVVSRRFTRFGVAMLDFDNDGLLDLYEAGGRVGLQSESFADDPYAEPNILFRGVAGGRFEEELPRGGTSSLLVATSRAAAFGDIDNDGGIDILVVNRDGPAHLLRNVAPDRGNWLLVRVLDTGGRDALGATLQIGVGARTIRRDVRSGYSYLAANDPRVHVGLGREGRVDAISVRWPDGMQEHFGPFDVNRIVELRRGSGSTQAAAR